MGQLDRERIATGNHARIFVAGDRRRIIADGKPSGPIGNATDVSFSSSLGTRAHHCIGETEPFDVVRGVSEHSVTLSSYTLRSGDAADLINGGAVDIEIFDRFNGKIIKTMYDCHVTNEAVRVGTGVAITRELSFVARGHQG